MSDPQRTPVFSSSLGTVLSLAGVAIGLGNIWRFPYMMGQYGGSAFLVTYLLIAFGFGVPALITELALGRRTRRGPWGAYQSAGMPWARVWASLMLITAVMAASYYAVIIGWVLQEAVTFMKAAATAQSASSFDDLTQSTGTQLVYVAVTVILGCSIIGFGVRGGIERASRFIMPLFFILFAALAVRALTLEGAGTGLKVFLKPELQNFTGRTALAAMGQAVFSLGLGGMFMVRYGSYMSDQADIPKEAIATTVADVAAALLAGLVIVPAVFVYGLDLQGGPSLMFLALPEVFTAMPAGAVFGAVFFLAVFLVAVLSLIAAYEVIATALQESLGWSRTLSLVLIAVVEILLAVPCYKVTGYIASSDLIWGSTMQPIGAVIAIVALAWCVGRTKTLDQMRRNSVMPIPGWLFYWIKFAVPTAILVILIYGWVDWFGSK